MKRSDTTAIRVSKSLRIVARDLNLSTPGAVAYASRNDDTDVVETLIHLSRPDVNDLGNPIKLTITIEPGDRLNP